MLGCHFNFYEWIELGLIFFFSPLLKLVHPERSEFRPPQNLKLESLMDGARQYFLQTIPRMYLNSMICGHDDQVLLDLRVFFI
jgi:hypothetical protein